MAPIVLPTTPATSSDTLPVALWVLVAAVAYLFLVTIIIFIRQCLVQRGFCAECNCCGKSEGSCSDCFIPCAQACNCYTPDVNSCCDAICGPRQKCDPLDCCSGNCCSGGCCEGGGGFCEVPTGPGCPSCDCPQVNCQRPVCDEIVCCCIRITIA